MTITKGYVPTGWKGKRLVMATDDGLVRLWHLERQTEVVPLRGNASYSAFAFSPDGTRLAVAGNTDGAVTLYDTETGHEVAGFNAGESEFRQVAFTRDGKYARGARPRTAARLARAVAGGN